MSLFNNGNVISPDLYPRETPYEEETTDAVALRANHDTLDINLSTPAKITIAITSIPLTQTHIDNGQEFEHIGFLGSVGSDTNEWIIGDGSNIGDVRKLTNTFDLTASKVAPSFEVDKNYRASASIKVEYLVRHKYRRDNGIGRENDLTYQDVDDNFEIIKDKLANIPSSTANQTGAEIKIAYELEDDTNAFTDAKVTKLDSIEAGATVGAKNFVSLSDTPSTLTAGKFLKVNTTGDGIIETDEPSGGGSALTGSEIKTAYENNSDTNAFTDTQVTDVSDAKAAKHTHINTTMLGKIGEDSAGDLTYNGNKADTTIAQRDVYDGLDSLDNTISLSANQGKVLKDVQDTQQTKLDNIEDNSTADQTGSEIKIAYEAESDTNAFTDALKTKLDSVAPSASGNFLGLSDTPNTLTADKWLKVNSAGDALEETDAPSSSLNSITTDKQAQTKIGDLTIGQTLDVLEWAYSGTTITLSNLTHNLVGIGQKFELSGLVSDTNAPNGRWEVASIVSAIEFTFIADLTPTGTATVSSATLESGDFETRGTIKGRGILTTESFLHIQDQKPSGTHGGGTGGGWEARVLNTVVRNTIAGASLASDKVTLPIGKYFIKGTTMSYDTAGGRFTRLQNETDATTALRSRTGRGMGSSGGYNMEYEIEGYIEITAIKEFKLYTYVTSTNSWGLGYPASIAGEIEIYSDLQIWKVG